MTNRYQHLFSTLQAKQQGAFVPFVTLGDPNRELSMAIVDTLVESGADALELGFPFSDPSADGPTIQSANIRALTAGITPDSCFEMLSAIREKHPTTPIGLLVYANLVYAGGIEQFYRRCADVGVDSVLIADVPAHESAPFREAAEAFNIAPIFIAPPNGDEQTTKTVCEYSQGYIYLLSRAGVTGAETKAGKPVASLLANIQKYDGAPPLLGFGIAAPEQVAEAVAAGAAGAISGSAVVKIIERNLDDQAALLSELSQFVQAMKAATQR